MTSLPYAPGSDTSRDAAETGKTNAAKWRARVAAMFATNQGDGYTADELALWFGVPANTIAPRITSLKQYGEIADIGLRRKTRSGKNAVVWVQAKPREWCVTFYVNGLCESERLFALSKPAAIRKAICIAIRNGIDVASSKITAERV